MYWSTKCKYWITFCSPQSSTVRNTSSLHWKLSRAALKWDRGGVAGVHFNSFQGFFPWRWGGSSTQAWMPTYVSILRIPQITWVWRTTVEWYIGRRKPKNSEKNLSQCPFVHQKSHMDWPGREPWNPRWGTGDWRPEPWHGRHSRASPAI
jgi:hypothetical protein